MSIVFYFNSLQTKNESKFCVAIIYLNGVSILIHMNFNLQLSVYMVWLVT